MLEGCMAKITTKEVQHFMDGLHLCDLYLRRGWIQRQKIMEWMLCDDTNTFYNRNLVRRIYREKHKKYMYCIAYLLSLIHI